MSLARLLGLLAAALAGAVLTLLLRSPERLPALDARTLEQARQRWEGAGIGSYRMVLEMTGSDLPNTRYEVEARDGAVRGVRRDGTALATGGEAYGVPGLLGILEQELDLARDPSRSFGAPAGYQVHLMARFDARGVPRAFRRVVGGTGRFSEWKVLRFEVP